jgi:hypothetical protein
MKILLIVLLTISTLLSAIDSKGKEFSFAYIPNAEFDSLHIYVTSEHNTTGLIEAQDFNVSIPFSLQSGESKVFDLPIELAKSPNAVVSKYAVNVFAKEDISVFTLNHSAQTSDSMLILPNKSLGLRYMLMSYAGISFNGDYPPTAIITAIHDNTKILIISEKIKSENGIAVPVSVTLNKGDTCRFQPSLNTFDPTGTEIIASSPISVVSGVTGTQVPGGKPWIDHIVEMIPPVSSWGKTFLTKPFGSREKGDLLRVLASENNTTITINDEIVATLKKGEYFETIRDDATLIKGTKPLLVAQYSLSQFYDRTDGDPSMMLIVPVSQYMNKYSFVSPGEAENISKHFISVVIPSASIGTLRLDNQEVNISSFIPIRNSSYSTAHIKVASGAHTIFAEDEFGLSIYGFGFHEAYSHVGGMNVNIINNSEDSYLPNVSIMRTGITIIGVATDSEDINANGILEIDEDLNENNLTDKRSEDRNQNGILDVGEDDNNDSILNQDTGIFFIKLDENATNLELFLSDDPIGINYRVDWFEFTPGEKQSYFLVRPINPFLPASGTVIIMDGVNNTVKQDILFTAKYPDVHVKSVLSTDEINLDESSFNIAPNKMTTTIDRTTIEWDLNNFKITDIKDLGYEVVLRNLIPGESRLLTYGLEVSYTNVDDTFVSYHLGEQHIKVLAPIVNIIASSNKNIYHANEEVLFNLQIINRSEEAVEVIRDLVITDSSGNVVKHFEQHSLGEFAIDSEQNVSQTWNTELLFEGDYLLKASTLDAGGNLSDTDTIAFSIVKTLAVDENNETQVPFISIRTILDNKRYDTSEVIKIENVMSNSAQNANLENAELLIELINSSGDVLISETQTIDNLFASSFEQRINRFSLENLSSGEYHIKSTLYDPNGEALAQKLAPFSVEELLYLRLGAEVNTSSHSVVRGENVNCTFSYENIGNKEAIDIGVRQILVNFSDETIITTHEQNISLATSSHQNMSHLHSSAALEEGNYGCIAQANIENSWQTLASDSFSVEVPPIGFTTEITMGGQARLLVLMDGIVETRTHRWFGATREDSSEPYSPQNAPDVEAQIAYMENFLSSNAFSYKIVTNRSDFESAFHTGEYNSYLLLSERVKFSKPMIHELREAVYRGEGLVVAGMHDMRNFHLGEVLGVHFTGVNRQVKSLSSEALSFDNQVLALDDTKLHVEPIHATTIANYTLDEAEVPNNHGYFGRHHANFCLEDNTIAITENSYNKGSAILVGFDLLLYAMQDEGVKYDELLLQLLNRTAPKSYTANAGDIVPITLTHTNTGVATAGESHSTLYGGEFIVNDSGEGSVNEEGEVVMPFYLAENNSTSSTFYITLPSSDTLNIQSSIFSGSAWNLIPYETIEQSFAIGTTNSIDDLIDMIDVRHNWHLSFVHGWLKRAKRAERRGYPTFAHAYILKAIYALKFVRCDNQDELHLALSTLLRAQAQKIAY